MTVTQGMPKRIECKVMEACELMDSVFPGTLATLKRLGINFVYDPKNDFYFYHNGPTERYRSLSSYTRRLNAFSFNDNGLQRSIPRELVHVLDVHAGFKEIPLSIAAFSNPDGSPIGESIYESSDPITSFLTDVFTSFNGREPKSRGYVHTMLVYGIGFDKTPNISRHVHKKAISFLNLEYSTRYIKGFRFMVKYADFDPNFITDPNPSAVREKANRLAVEYFADFFERVLQYKTRKTKADFFFPSRHYTLKGPGYWNSDYIEDHLEQASTVWNTMLARINSLRDGELRARRIKHPEQLFAHDLRFTA